MGQKLQLIQILFCETGIVTEAGAESVLKVVSVTKARAIYQKTAAVLYKLLHEVYEKDNNGESIDEWALLQESLSPTFKFWMMILKLITLLLSFVWSLRLGNYHLFLTSLKNMISFFFGFDHIHYARWLSVHLKDLEELNEKAPDVHKEFCNGNFMVQKTYRKFSALAVDQAHEQNNAIIKGDGGAIGLTEDPAALRRWLVAGPEVCRLINEFTRSVKDTSQLSFCHHEETKSFKKKFTQDCCALYESFSELGNPFLEVTSDLVTIGNRVVVPEEGSKILYSIEDESFELYKTFLEERFLNQSKTLFDSMKKRKNQIFSCKKSPEKSPMNRKGTDEELFSKLFIASQHRKLDLDKFFTV